MNNIAFPWCSNIHAIGYVEGDKIPFLHGSALQYFIVIWPTISLNLIDIMNNYHPTLNMIHATMNGQHQTTRKSWWWLIVRNQFVDVIMLSWSRIAVNYHTYHIRHCKLCEQFKLWNCQMTVNAIIFASGFRDASK